MQRGRLPAYLMHSWRGRGMRAIQVLMPCLASSSGLRASELLAACRCCMRGQDLIRRAGRRGSGAQCTLRTVGLDVMFCLLWRHCSRASATVDDIHVRQLVRYAWQRSQPC